LKPSPYLNFLLTMQNYPAPTDDAAMRVLEVIATHECSEPITVMQIMQMTKLGSPATNHRRLDALRELGLIEARHAPGNRRTKYLHTTRAAKLYFAAVDVLFAYAVEESRL
jgi:DNA-binding MarR family transcriptional regulator